MLRPKEEAQGIKRVNTIKNDLVKDIESCEDLLRLFMEVLEKTNINITDFIIVNNIFGYNYVFNINVATEKLVHFKNIIIEKNKVCKEIEPLEEVIKAQLGEEAGKLILSYGVQLMYEGEFNRAFSVINFISKYKNELLSNIIYDKDKLNEFIFKINLAVDITKLENYKEACDILEEYYLNGIRNEKCDQLLVVLYNYLNQNKKSNEVLNSICNVSNNALFYYEIGNKGSKMPIIKKKIVVLLSIVILLGIGIYGISKINIPKAEKKNQNTNVNNNKPQTNKSEETNEKPVEEKKNITINELKNIVTSGDENKIEEAIKSVDIVSLNENDKKEYDKILNEYKTKKQEYYYNKGRGELKGDVAAAIESFKKAYDYRCGGFLDSHVTFYLASAIKKENPKESLTYYKEYIDKYKDIEKSYVEESLYNLALINYENGDTKEARKYANMLKDKYPKSIYNNEKIKSIK